MKALPSPLLVFAVLLSCMTARGVSAQAADPGVTAAELLLKQAVQPQRDGSHSAMLLGLRKLEDEALLPLFRGLAESPYLSMRIHGRLGAAALSPQRRIDLAGLAEIEDQRELVQVLSAAIDDELIDNKAMATLLTWDGLDLPLRQAIALRLIAAGGEVDTAPFRESLQVELNAELSPGKMLQYALAALVLAQSGDDAGKAALTKLAALRGGASEVVLAQALDAAMRNGFTTAGGLGLAVAKDTQRDPSLRLLAIQTAMRLNTDGAASAWAAMFQSEQSSAQRIRLAMLALDSADGAEPGLFDVLENQGEMIGAIAQAGRAIAEGQDDLAAAFKPLLATAQPLPAGWIVNYCQRTESDHGPQLLTLLSYPYHPPQSHHRDRLHQTKSDAVMVLCETYPDEANALLPKFLEADGLGQGEADDEVRLVRRRLMLFGIARARSQQIGPLAASLKPDGFDDFTTEALRLFIRARHDAPLTKEEWATVSDIVQGVGQLDTTMRLQLGWAYLKHKGATQRAVIQALK